jgi:hypothetical protein
MHGLNPSSCLCRTYSNGNLNVDLFIAFYAQQRAGESMYSPKHCLPGAGWEIWNYDTMEIPAAGKVDRIIASEYLGKLLLARDALLENATAASIVRLILPDQPGVPQAARNFASELIPQVQVCFGR